MIRKTAWWIIAYFIPVTLGSGYKNKTRKTQMSSRYPMSDSGPLIEKMISMTYIKSNWSMKGHYQHIQNFTSRLLLIGFKRYTARSLSEFIFSFWQETIQMNCSRKSNTQPYLHHLKTSTPLYKSMQMKPKSSTSKVASLHTSNLSKGLKKINMKIS